jgi:hypothetical protein
MVSKSKGPRPRKGRMGKKKRKLVEAHTLAHLRGAHDYSHSHTRTRQIDTRFAGAGVLGARMKAPRHQGVTVPPVPRVPQPRALAQREVGGRQMPVKAPTRKSLTIMGPQGPKGDPGQAGSRGNRGKKGRSGKDGRHGKPGGIGPEGPSGAMGGIGRTG